MKRKKRRISPNAVSVGILVLGWLVSAIVYGSVRSKLIDLAVNVTTAYINKTLFEKERKDQRVKARINAVHRR